MKPKSPEKVLRCSFCHKSQDEVAKLIATPKCYPPAYICNECVNVCNSILQEDAVNNLKDKTQSWFSRIRWWSKYGIIEDNLFKH